MPGLLPAVVLRQRRDLLPYLPGAALFLLCGLCFSGILRSSFVWDDWMLVVHTWGFRGWDIRHLQWMFTTFRLSNYTPLAWVSYAVDYSLWRLDPLGYHLSNLLLHSAGAVLFFGLARALLRRALPDAKDEALAAGAFLAALIFAVHPLRVESVSWVSQRRDLLSGVFFLATLRLYVEGRRGAAAGAFVLAALSKPSVVPLPAVLLILDFYPLRRRPSWGLLIEKAPFFLAAGGLAFLAIRAQTVTGNFTALSRFGLLDRLAQSLHGLGFYVAKTALPAGLSPLYPLPGSLSLWSPLVLQSLLALAAAAAALHLCGVPGRASAALWAYYAAMVLPVLGLLQNGPQLVALRYSYLPCLGWALLAGAGAARAARAWRWAPAALAAAVLAAFVPATQAQIRVCRDDVSLWSAAASRFPDSFDARLNLADALAGAGRAREALPHAREALRLSRGDDGKAVLCLSKALAADGALAEARQRLEGLVKAHPDWAKAQELLGVVLARQGRKDQALERFAEAAALDPRSAQARYNAGVLLAGQGRMREAESWLEQAARLEPEEPLYRGAWDAAARGSSQFVHNSTPEKP